MINAALPAETPAFDNALISVGFTLIGGVCFLIGSLLMLPENGAKTVDRSQRLLPDYIRIFWNVRNTTLKADA